MTYNFTRVRDPWTFYDQFDPSFYSYPLPREPYYYKPNNLSYGYYSDSVLFKPDLTQSQIDNFTDSFQKSILKNQYTQQRESKKPVLLPPLQTVQHFTLENPVFKIIRNDEEWLLNELQTDRSLKTVNKDDNSFRNQLEFPASNKMKHTRNKNPDPTSRQNETNKRSDNKVETNERASSPIKSLTPNNPLPIVNNPVPSSKIPVTRVRFNSQKPIFEIFKHDEEDSPKFTQTEPRPKTEQKIEIEKNPKPETPFKNNVSRNSIQSVLVYNYNKDKGLLKDTIVTVIDHKKTHELIKRMFANYFVNPWFFK